jgi:hypothetical protein
MRVHHIVAVTCLGMLGASGCAHSTQSCAVADYGAGQFHGLVTPRQALTSAIAAYPSLSRDGWVTASRGASAVEFRSSDDVVDVVKRSDGQWQIGAVTICK